MGSMPTPEEEEIVQSASRAATRWSIMISVVVLIGALIMLRFFT